MTRVMVWDGTGLVNAGTGLPPGAAYDWSDASPPWAYSSAADWEQHLPAGVPVVNLSTGSADFWTNLDATQAAQPGRFICRLPEGVFSLTQFRMIGSSGNPTYAFGLWFPKLAGFVGAGPDKTIVEMAAGSVNGDQLAHMATMTQASFEPLNMGLARIDTQYGGVGAPVYLGGVGIESAPQPLLTSISPDITGSVYVPQPAPHHGVVLYSDSSRRHPDTVVTHCRFRGAGRAMTSQPPFECGNIGSQRNHITYRSTEFDGRCSPRYDPSRPRKCGPVMLNGGVHNELVDCWLHHSNVSRYAANDESVVSATALTNDYILTRCKIEQITNNQNRQPPLNGGNSLGGYTNASCCGWESSNARITITDCIMSQDNNQFAGQVPMHLQFTNTGAARQGGRLFVVGGEYRNTGWPQLDQYLCFRIQPTSHWATDGYATTLDIRKTAGGPRLAPHTYGGTWPPSPAYLVAQSLSPDTHYIVRST